MTHYRPTEVGHLREGVEFIDANDIPQVVTSFSFFHDNPGIVTVHTDLLPMGTVYATTALVWTQS